jgi:RNA polymerase sigma factor (sigma-70 family)
MLMAVWGADGRYTRLVEQHGSGLLHLAILLTGNRHDAEDIVQDVLISVAAAWPVAKPLPYLKRAVANRATDILRKRHDVLTDAPPETPRDDPGLLQYEEDREFFARLQHLPERQRAVLVLRFHADLDDAAVGAILGITPATVRSQAHHALTKLREAHAAQTLTEEQ